MVAAPYPGVRTAKSADWLASYMMRASRFAPSSGTARSVVSVAVIGARAASRASDDSTGVSSRGLVSKEAKPPARECTNAARLVLTYDVTEAAFALSTSAGAPGPPSDF